ncbi:MAG: 4Fe-4S cluster-binding domain-containing protein [Phascolarctobacterium sp.]|nr:4Fe-4S cluster-binding domain-containing protein [Candidatus Phascolarctobacterium equi]
MKKSNVLKLIIATTTKCNARCDYCFECNDARSDMTPEVEENITKFIDKRIGTNKKLSISWFGGEPLLNTGLMDRISQYCFSKNYKLDAILVTNVSLLNEEMLRDSFPKWKIRNIDITLDGTAQEYARIKNYLAPELGNLDRILNNIELASKYKIHVRIRLNVNKKNAEDLLILVEQLKQRFDGNQYVTWYMAPLLNTGADFDTEEEWIAILEKYISLSPYKMSLSYSKMLPKIEYCLAERSRSYGIDVNGDIKICGTHFTDNSKTIGNIQNFDSRRDMRRKYPQLFPKCQRCCWLPMCGGGCITRHIHNAIACTPKKYFLIATLRQLTK